MNKYNRLAISGMILILVPSILLLLGLYYIAVGAFIDTTTIRPEPITKNVIIKTDTVKIEIPCTRTHCDSHKSKKHHRDTLTNRVVSKELTDTL